MCYKFFFFFFNDTATTEIYTLSLHDALPICDQHDRHAELPLEPIEQLENLGLDRHVQGRSEEHTSELQSPCNLVCRLLLEKKKKRNVRTPLVVTKQQMLATQFLTPTATSCTS